MKKTSPASATDFSFALARAKEIRRIYHQLELRNHGSKWSLQEDMIGFTHDVGELGKLIMAAENRWGHTGDLPQDLSDKLAECVWWLLIFSDRLGVDLNQAFAAKMADLEKGLTSSAASPAATS